MRRQPASVPAWGNSSERPPAAAKAWAGVPEILSRIVPPKFPDREFAITRFGAVGDGTNDCTRAFADAIAACHEAGGGRVTAPPGIFLSGAIHLLSNVNLHLAQDATIRFSTDPKKFLPVVFSRDVAEIFESRWCRASGHPPAHPVRGRKKLWRWNWRRRPVRCGSTARVLARLCEFPPLRAARRSRCPSR